MTDSCVEKDIEIMTLKTIISNLKLNIKTLENHILYRDGVIKKYTSLLSVYSTEKYCFETGECYYNITTVEMPNPIFRRRLDNDDIHIILKVYGKFYKDGLYGIKLKTIMSDVELLWKVNI